MEATTAPVTTGSKTIADHAEDVGGDAPPVALIEHLEGAVVAAPYRSDERVVIPLGLLAPGRARDQRLHAPYPLARSDPCRDSLVPAEL